MISVFLREQKRYTKKELIHKLILINENDVNILKRLKEYGILKTVRNTPVQMDLSDLLEEDIEITTVENDSVDYYYVFTFVGVLAINGRILKCFPKYIKNNKSPRNELKQILRVLEKYNKKEQIIQLQSSNSDGKTFNSLSVMLFLINDYHHNGSYSSTHQITEVNGTGEILWDKTINETFTLISQNRPFYPELLTKRSINNEQDYFKRLYDAIITKCSNDLETADLLDLFDILAADITDEAIEDFGEVDYILDRISKELNVQFNTHKQLILKTMYSYIANGTSLDDTSTLNMYGTNSFNLVWEEICSEIFENKLKSSLDLLAPIIGTHPDYKHTLRLVDLIEKPLWTSGDFEKTAKKTLIPDSISIVEINSKIHFIIFDAKYYNFQLIKDKLSGYPGIESITKQYLYQLAYKKFTMDFGIDTVKNCFLFPSEDEIDFNGNVSMQIIDELGLEKIQVRLLFAPFVYDYYLNNKKFDISLLNL